MSRRAQVYQHGRLAGILEQTDDGAYRFAYSPEYLADPDAPPVSLTLPRPGPHQSDHLFAFFHGLAAEGSTRLLQANLLRIDPDDLFGLLVAAGDDLIGSVTIQPDEAS